MPTLREILYAFFILVVIIVVGLFLLAIVRELDDEIASASPDSLEWLAV